MRREKNWGQAYNSVLEIIMNKDVTRKSVLSNFLWRFAERSGAQSIQFVVSIVLARILAPDDYGTIALITVFIAILNVFINNGLGNALIQKKDADEIDFSTVFYANIVICSVLYLLLFFSAPYISKFYENESLTSLTRVLGLTIIISGVKNVQQALVARRMIFRKFFFATLGGTIGSAIIGIWMALKGYGVWALVTQTIFNNVVDTVILWITVGWRPTRTFSFERLKGLYSYGWKLLASSLIETLYNNLRSLIIGKMYTASDLAYYNKGKMFPGLIIDNINSAISSVLFPVMSYAQNEIDIVKSMTRRAIKISTYILAPLMLGLAIVAEPLVCLLLTENWLECIPYMRIICLVYMLHPIHTSNLNAISAMGRSDLYLKLEIIKKVIGIIVLLGTVKGGVMAMTYSLLFTSVISQIINSWPNRKLLNYGYLEQLKDILPEILLAVFVSGCVGLVALLQLPDIVTLFIQVSLGAIVYIGLSKLFRLDSFEYLWGIIKPMITKQVKKRI